MKSVIVPLLSVSNNNNSRNFYLGLKAVGQRQKALGGMPLT